MRILIVNAIKIWQACIRSPAGKFISDDMSIFEVEKILIDKAGSV